MCFLVCVCTLYSMCMWRWLLLLTVWGILVKYLERVGSGTRNHWLHLGHVLHPMWYLKLVYILAEFTWYTACCSVLHRSHADRQQQVDRHCDKCVVSCRRVLWKVSVEQTLIYLADRVFPALTYICSLWLCCAFQLCLSALAVCCEEFYRKQSCADCLLSCVCSVRQCMHHRDYFLNTKVMMLSFYLLHSLCKMYNNDLCNDRCLLKRSPQELLLGPEPGYSVCWRTMGNWRTMQQCHLGSVHWRRNPSHSL